MSRAGFGESFKSQGHDEREAASPEEVSMSYKDSSKIILENCIPIFALGTKLLATPWLPQKLRRVHNACISLQNDMIEVYEEEKRAFVQASLLTANS